MELRELSTLALSGPDIPEGLAMFSRLALSADILSEVHIPSALDMTSQLASQQINR